MDGNGSASWDRRTRHACAGLCGAATVAFTSRVALALRTAGHGPRIERARIAREVGLEGTAGMMRRRLAGART